MNQLVEYNLALRNLFETFTEASSKAQILEYVHLDSIDRILRGTLSIEEMRNAGCFFTGDELALDLIDKFKKPITNKSIVLDPTCGAGNLLIACSRKLKIKKSLRDTLVLWGRVLHGFDLYESFVESTKLRIILEAVSRGCVPDCKIQKAMDLLSNINVCDTMILSEDMVSKATHIVMNPPFSLWPSPKINFWKKGRVNAAAIVAEHILRIIPDNCEISAILPDVLRSGSRYESWRLFLEKKCQGNIQLIGKFNDKTNVDVFILSGKKALSNKLNNIEWVFNHLEAENTIEDEFDVSVGRLVAYRDPQKGPYYPYVHPKNVKPWSVIKDFTENRRFLGTVIKPPFVVIRRTSSPKDKYRALGAIITGKKSVAVENHLIIIKPKKPTIKACKALLKILKSEQTNAFLNNRIRCRHLTVGSVKQIPMINAAK
jgi:hypothetical protein